MPNRCPLTPDERSSVLDFYKKTGVLTVRDADPEFDGFQNPSANVVGSTFYVTSVHPQTGRVSTDQNLRHTRFIERIFVGSKAWPDGILAGGFDIESRATADSGEFKKVDRRYDFSHSQLEKLQTLSDNRRWVDWEDARAIERQREIKRREATETALDMGGTIKRAVTEAATAVGTAVAQALAGRPSAQPVESDGATDEEPAPAPVTKGKRGRKPAAPVADEETAEVGA